MITDGEKWRYLAVKCLSALFRGIISNKNGDFFLFKLFSFIQDKRRTPKT